MSLRNLRRTVGSSPLAALLVGILAFTSCGDPNAEPTSTVRAAVDDSPDDHRGEVCVPGPDPSVPVDTSFDNDRRGEALVEYLTGFDALNQPPENEGIDPVLDDPNFGGVWGDRSGGWVVAVVECSLVDANRIAALAGGAEHVRLIEVSHSYEEVNTFRDTIVRRARAGGVPADIGIDSTLSGRVVDLTVEDPAVITDALIDGVPPHLVVVTEGELARNA